MLTYTNEPTAAQLLFLDVPAPVLRRQIAHRAAKSILAEMARLAEQYNAAAVDPADRKQISSPAEAAAILTPLLAGRDQEYLYTLTVDTRNRVISINEVYHGSLNTSLIRIGEIFRAAIIDNAAAIILAHNHPSGDPSPSPEDVAVTRAVVEAGKLLDIDCLDHLVIGAGRFISLKERGLGFSG